MLKSPKKLLAAFWSPIKSSIRHNPYPVSFIHFLKNIPQAQYTKLCNGLTIVTDERESCNVCIGLYVDAGSRYESDFENGIAHFFEHIAFKGTFARPKTALEEQMACTGSRYGCFTTREMVGYYAECLFPHVPLTVNLLSDCVFNNAFCEADIEQQKKTVYLEMQEHDKNANNLVDDYLHTTAFQGTPLARTVMGPSCNLYNFNSATIPRYLNKYYDADRTALVAVGGVKHEQMVSLAEIYLSKLEPAKCIDTDVYRFTGSEVRYRDDSLPVANVVVAVEGPSLCDEDNIVMEVAAEIVGGWDRSQPGGIDHSFPVARAASASPFCDAYKAIHINYKDTGLWGVQFVGPTNQLDDMLYSVQKEWMNMCNMVTDKEVERAKRVLKCKLLSQYESLTSTCHETGRWALYQGYRPPLPERICAVDRVFAKDVRETCSRYLYDKCPAVVAVGPTEGLNDYTRIRAGMYWLRI